jgi:hypothetical protein
VTSEPAQFQRLEVRGPIASTSEAQAVAVLPADAIVTTAAVAAADTDAGVDAELASSSAGTYQR